MIFILSDDIGYDLLSVNGNKSYSTPRIDSMAHHGINFTHCEGTPLCSPSRCMLLTGKYNFRNYSNWQYINDNEKTFGNVMQDAGYKTGFFGKLQLPFSYSQMASRGFDVYTVFELTGDTNATLRYKSPTLYDNTGKVPDSLVRNKYCDDILTSRILNFIDSNSNNPFFVYYSMSVAHKPFSPTPEDSAFKNWNPRTKISDTSFFGSMITHMDIEVGIIIDKLVKAGLDKNTIIVFAGDNGTPLEIFYDADDEDTNGEKRSTTEGGTHVPLIAYWPSHIPENIVNDDLIDFTDFLPTFAEAAGVKDLSAYDTIDGLSFYNRMLGIEDHSKPQLFMHYCAHPGFEPLKRWVRDKNYKLYDSLNKGSYKFYNIIQDKEEKSPLSNSKLTKQEKDIKKRFKYILDSMPTWPDAPVLDNPFVRDITAKSVTIGATIISSGSTALVDRGSNISGPPVLPTLGTNSTHDSPAVPGTFFQSRTNLASENQYSFSLFAMNKNMSHSTGYAKGKFYTLSMPPAKQPSFFKACADSSSILLNWSNAVFPSSGAKLKGYAIFYSTDSIVMSQNANGHDLSKVTTNASLLYADSNTGVSKLDTVLHVTSVAKFTLYHFILIPYTWNGTTDSTYNYLTKDALTTTTSISDNVFSLNTSNKDPLCFDDANGSIEVFASNGNSPYLFQLNQHDYTSDSVFSNLADGYYKVRVKDNNGCIDSTSIHLKASEKLQLNLSEKDADCTPDGQIIASASKGVSPYLFSFNNGEFDTVHQFTNLATGNYTIKAKDGNKCTVSADVIVKATQNCFAGITISPNPTNSEFKLRIGNDQISNHIIIKVYDDEGKLVYSNHGSNTKSYSFGKNFMTGVYFVRVESDNNKYNFKIIKE